jgi:class 3 adenylate cyclase
VDIRCARSFVRQTLRTFRSDKQVFESLVAMHRARAFNTAGDAILAEFPSAMEAVRRATDIQAAWRRRNDQLPPSRQIRFRIGINLGDMMLHGQDLLGDGVNVAARLQTAASPRGTCISGGVYDQISAVHPQASLGMGCAKCALNYRTRGRVSVSESNQIRKRSELTSTFCHLDTPTL